jgi:hypothetical protein
MQVGNGCKAISLFTLTGISGAWLQRFFFIQQLPVSPLRVLIDYLLIALRQGKFEMGCVIAPLLLESQEGLLVRQVQHLGEQPGKFCDGIRSIASRIPRFVPKTGPD